MRKIGYHLAGRVDGTIQDRVAAIIFDVKVTTTAVVAAPSRHLAAAMMLSVECSRKEYASLTLRVRELSAQQRERGRSDFHRSRGKTQTCRRCTCHLRT